MEEPLHQQKHASHSFFPATFRKAVTWNLISFFFQGVCASLTHLWIGKTCGPEGLGIFNQVLAYFILWSQFGAFGLHYSALKYSAEFHLENSTLRKEVGTAFLLSVLCTSAVTAASFFTTRSSLLHPMYGSEQIAEAWLWALPGLWFFSVNKVLLGILNGMQMMYVFALGSALRFVLWGPLLAIFVFAGFPLVRLPLILSGSELLTFLFLLGSFIRIRKIIPLLCWDSSWAKRHLHFGSRSFLSGTFVELCTRVDVIILGLFSNSFAVGIYTMASFIVEGFYQLPMAFRNNLNPILTQGIKRGVSDGIKAALARSQKKIFLGTLGLSLIAVSIFPLLVKFGFIPSEFSESWLPLAVMLTGLVIASPYLPLSMIFISAGRPLLQTSYQLAVLVVTALLNVILIPRSGVVGAAIAMAGAFVFSAFLLRVLSRQRLGIRI